MRALKDSFNKDGLVTRITMLFIAFLLWAYVMSETNPEITQEYKNISVKYTNEVALTRDNVVIMEPQEVRINVKVSGKRSDINKFNAARIEARVDLMGYTEGERKVPIEVSLANQYSGVKIVDFSPREALFVMDKISTKEIPVEINYHGNLPEGYVLGNPTVKPQSILISGPKSWLSEIVKAQAIIDLTGKTKETYLSAPLRIMNDKGDEVRGIARDPGIIDISLPVLKTIEVPIFIELMENIPENYEITNIEIEPNMVMIKGPEGIGEIREINTKKIDMNRFLDSDFTNIALDLPEGVSLLNPNQEIKITYSVHKLSEKTFELPRNTIEMRNLRSGYIYNMDQDEGRTISLIGYEEKIEKLKIEDIYPFVDVGGLGEGSHMIKIKIDDIDNIEVKTMEPGSIKVEIEKRQ